MRSSGPARLATRMMTAQVLVIAVGALALIGAAVVLAPALFRYHLALTGESDPLVLHHAEQAFVIAFGSSLLVGTVVSLAAAGVASWFIVRRVAHPVEELADAAEVLAAGNFEVTVPGSPFSSEIARLTVAFDRMAVRLADTEDSRRRLLSDLAHELRTPLATLEAYVDGVEDGVLAQEAATFATMRAQIERLRRLSTDLREAALAEEHALGMRMERVDLRDVVAAAVVAEVPRYEAAGLELAFATPDGSVAVQADPIRLAQVLGNLLENALRYARAKVDVSLAVDAPNALITVCDDGEGIPPEHAESIFHRFHRVDPARPTSDGSGSGLGLTIARAIVEDHAGAIWVEPASPGARFTVRLPVTR